jgi:cytidylate kinase
VACELNLGFDREGRILIDGRLGEPGIRSSTVTLNVSAVSAHPGVREAVVHRQREIGNRSPGIVAEGRDTTTVVFPEADHKFFLNASADERARRRALQDGTLERLDEVRDDIERRDRLDTTRAHSPLKQAPDAIVVEADGLAVHEVVDSILERIRGGAPR